MNNTQLHTLKVMREQNPKTGRYGAFYEWENEIWFVDNDGIIVLHFTDPIEVDEIRTTRIVEPAISVLVDFIRDAESYIEVKGEYTKTNIRDFTQITETKWRRVFHYIDFMDAGLDFVVNRKYVNRALNMIKGTKVRFAYRKQGRTPIKIIGNNCEAYVFPVLYNRKEG